VDGEVGEVAAGESVRPPVGEEGGEEAHACTASGPRRRRVQELGAAAASSVGAASSSGRHSLLRRCGQELEPPRLPRQRAQLGAAGLLLWHGQELGADAASPSSVPRSSGGRTATNGI
jgi:hypothetical protein